MPAKQQTIGAQKEPINGPGVLTHLGGDAILIADVDENGFAGTERTLFFEGEEVVIDGDDEFKPSDETDRSTEIPGAAQIRALGQATYKFDKSEAKQAAENLEDRYGGEFDEIAALKARLMELEEKPKAKKAPKQKAAA